MSHGRVVCKLAQLSGCESNIWPRNSNSDHSVKMKVAEARVLVPSASSFILS